MSIEKQMVEVFNRFLDDKIEGIKVIEKNFDDYNDYRKYAFITTENGKEVIIKAYKNDYNSPHQVEGYGELCETYKQNGINVPLFYKTKDNKYCTQYEFNNGTHLIWCEEKFSYETMAKIYEENSRLTSEFYGLMGSFVGRMHSVSKKNKISYQWNSSLVLFDTFSHEDKFDENYQNAKNFYDNLSKYDIDTKNLLEKIWDVYSKKRKEIEKVYPKLPYGAVQGDLSLCNILGDEKKNPVAVIDFNQSGNAVFVNDMMQWAVYFVFSSEDKEFDSVMKNNFKEYFKAYTEHYTFTDEELSCINNLYNIIRPFRYFGQEEVVIKLVEEGKIEEVDKYLEWVLYELTREDILEFI